MTKPRTYLALKKVPQPGGAVLFVPETKIVPAEVTVKEFCEMTGATKSTVLRHCDEGDIEFRRHGPARGAKLLIPLAEVERWMTNKE